MSQLLQMVILASLHYKISEKNLHELHEVLAKQLETIIGCVLASFPSDLSFIGYGVSQLIKSIVLKYVDALSESA